MKLFSVEVRTSETSFDKFDIEAEDLETAQRDAMTEAVERGYEVDDVIDVYEVDTVKDTVQDYLDGEEYELIDNTKYYKPVSISESRSEEIIKSLEWNPGDFFQTLINEFAVEYDSNKLTQKIIEKLQECKELAETLVS